MPTQAEGVCGHNDGFQQLNEDSNVELPHTSELCRICACTSSELMPIFGADGQELQLSDKILQHLPITVRKLSLRFE
jgi:hypothetical protein